MNKILATSIFSACALFGTFSHAQTEAAKANIEVLDSYANATLPGQVDGAARLTVRNNGDQNDRIIEVRANVSKITEIHDMRIEDYVMRMFRIDGIDVPAHSTVTMGESNKLHIMFIELNKPLVAGEKFNADVVFEKAGVVPVQVTVRERKQKARHGASEQSSAHDAHAK